MAHRDASAFPADPMVHSPGLTKREWFAGLAMQAICGRGLFSDRYAVAEAACAVADALLAELAKPTGGAQ